MRILNVEEVKTVCGGQNLVEKTAKACEGKPDSADVKITSTASSNLGAGPIFGKEATVTITLEVNCGDFRSEQAKEGKKG